MTLVRIKGDLIEMADRGEFEILLHGCNCQNTMGSGIAKQMRAKWPGVYTADTKATMQWPNPVAKLGNFSTYVTKTSVSTGLIIVNCYTQLHYLPRGMDHFNYASFELILLKLLELAKPGVRFGLPLIGQGLAGGNENTINKIIEDFADEATKLGSTVTLVEYAG